MGDVSPLHLVANGLPGTDIPQESADTPPNTEPATDAVTSTVEFIGIGFGQVSKQIGFVKVRHDNLLMGIGNGLKDGDRGSVHPGLGQG